MKMERVVQMESGLKGLKLGIPTELLTRSWKTDTPETLSQGFSIIPPTATALSPLNGRLSLIKRSMALCDDLKPSLRIAREVDPDYTSELP